MEEKLPRKRRRAVGPKGSVPVSEEPLVERVEREFDLEKYLAERPPHHEPR